MQALAQKKDTKAEQATRVGGGVARRAAGTDLAGGDEPGDDPLARMRHSLDASPRVQTQLCLGRSLQRMDLGEDDEMTAETDAATAQREAAAAPEAPAEGAPPAAPNGTGLPDGLKSGIEQMSGLSMDDVRVHYNSARPARLQALAYAQGSDIHMGPGQEEHLPHEAWHVVQQKQGRVRPTLQLQGTAVNDDAALEQEADRMGAQAASVTQRRAVPLAAKAAAASGPVQAIIDVATLQNNTPGSLLNPRRSIKQIDTALGNYINAPGAGKQAALNALIAAGNVYIGGVHDAGRIAYVTNPLLVQANAEQALIGALGAAFGGLVPDLIVRIGGDAFVPQLTPVAAAIAPAPPTLLPGLVTAAGGGANLVALLALAQAATAVNAPALEDYVNLAGVGNLAGLTASLAAIQPANAVLMRGLIQVAGGANLAALANTIAAIQPANAGLLQGLVQVVGGGGNLAGLTNVINAITPANAFLLQGLIPAAGGAGNLAALVNLLNALTAGNAGIAQTLVTAVGGGGGLVGLTALVGAITAGNAYMLQGMIPAVGGAGGLVALTGLVNAITPANAYLLQGLIPAAGGAAGLPVLTNIVNAITPANAHELVTLIPLTGGAGALAALHALVVAAGVPSAYALPNMVRDAGGAGQVANLTAAITHNHAGQGVLAVDLARVVSGNGVEFQRLVAALPQFLQLVPAAAAPAPAVAAAVAAYNLGAGLPGNRHITVLPANLQHFLSRHTYRFFNFANIDDLNDQWPFLGGGTRASVEGQLVAALNAIAAGAGGANWWVNPGRSLQGLAVGAYSVTVGTRNPQGAAPGTPANPLEVGQFFPIAPNGLVQPFSGPQMRAIHKLL